MKQTFIEKQQEYASKLSGSVRYFAGKGQYEDGSAEQQAYIDGVETAIGMMYIDLTGTPKSCGIISQVAKNTCEEVRNGVDSIGRTLESYDDIWIPAERVQTIISEIEK